MINILSLGGWCAGNSAILDFLSKYENILYIKGDFDIFRGSGNLFDIIKGGKYHNNLIIKCITNIINSLKYRIIIFLKFYIFNRDAYKKKIKLIDYDYSIPFNLLLIYYLIVDVISFNRNNSNLIFWKGFLNNINKSYFTTLPKLTLYCNPIYFNDDFMNNNLWHDFFMPCKIIFVYRNPYDQLLDIINTGAHLKTLPIEFFGNTDELEPADRYLQVNKRIHEHRLNLLNKIDFNDVILISFEDFIRNHNEIKIKLLDFLGVRDNEIYKENFNFEESKKNIGNGINSDAVKELIKNKSYVMKEMMKIYEDLDNLPQNIKYK